MMRFYFSGIADHTIYQMLESANVQHILVDHADVKNIPITRQVGMLDSGAFRAFRQGKQLDMYGFLKSLERLTDRAELIIAPDVVGNPAQSFINWLAVKDARLLKDRLIPVWQWGASLEHLEIFLAESQLVGIGGLAQIFRSDKTEAEKRLRENTLTDLVDLCRRYPDRFHIFGLNYLKGIERLRKICFSCDSSVFLRGARYGFVIFEHEKTKHLTQAPACVIPAYKELDRAGRCIVSAANIETFLAK